MTRVVHGHKLGVWGRSRQQSSRPFPVCSTSCLRKGSEPLNQEEEGPEKTQDSTTKMVPSSSFPLLSPCSTKDYRLVRVRPDPCLQ